MMRPQCQNHNQTCRVKVDFCWKMFNETKTTKVVMDLLCHCRVYEQLRQKFLELVQHTNYPIYDIEFSCADRDGSTIVVNGYQVYNHMGQEYNLQSTLRLNVDIIEVSTGEKLAELDRLVHECHNKIKADKGWRVLKDTEIAEEQLSLRELFEAQQKEINSLRADMTKLKLENERRHGEKLEIHRGAAYDGNQDRFIVNHAKEKQPDNSSEVHFRVFCDECQNKVIGHRFKCTVCADYDLCQGCEAKGIHADHIMIRMIKQRYTVKGVDTVPLRLLPIMEKKLTIDRGTGPSSLNQSGAITVPSTLRSNLLASMASRLDSATALMQKKSPDSKMDYTTLMEKFSSNDSPNRNKRAYTNIWPQDTHVRPYSNVWSQDTHVPEITINPPKGQATPFEGKDYEMKLVSSEEKSKKTDQNMEDGTPIWQLYQQYFRQWNPQPSMPDGLRTDDIEYWRRYFSLMKNEELDIDSEDSDDDSDCSDSSESSDSSDCSGESVASFDELKELETSEEESGSEGSESDESGSGSDDFDVVNDEDVNEGEMHTAVAPTPEATD
ncbi:hypothetical protein L3Y34_003986 [Caenorhabditis briggsae]|uniref:ZZ-type domain-containing protein n=3 Tax=Caenorhabditis briggsae TaxID=6238 RepID=A0AAE9D6L7_CAEBR|nr:hypothetical protein L3Y34_003986 [Caenorhabditis briggsae]